MVLTKERKLKMYKDMCLIRLFELKAPQLFAEGLVTGEAHQYIGQEAVAVGISSALTKADSITSTHRGHGHLIAKGGDVRYMFAEIGGRATGYCHGKGGSMHITSREIGIYGANGMVGQGTGIAIGVAFANKYLKDGTVTVSYFGEGASNQGVVHESMNIASVHKLPVIFVCENNKYAVVTNYETTTSVRDIAVRAAAYDIPGVVVDGMDVEAVRQAALNAVKRARNGEGPTFIEAKCYRFHDHFAGYPRLTKYRYRSQEEIAAWKLRDPIVTYRAKLIDCGEADQAELEAIDKQAEAEIAAGVEFMMKQPFPDKADVFTDAYANQHYTMPIRGW